VRILNILCHSFRPLPVIKIIFSYFLKQLSLIQTRATNSIQYYQKLLYFFGTLQYYTRKVHKKEKSTEKVSFFPKSSLLLLYMLSYNRICCLLCPYGAQLLHLILNPYSF